MKKLIIPGGPKKKLIVPGGIETKISIRPCGEREWVNVHNITDPFAQWTDTIRIQHMDTNSAGGGESTGRDLTFDALRTRLMNDPNGFQEVRLDAVIDLTATAAFYKNWLSAAIPAGSIIDYAALFVQVAVADGNADTVYVALASTHGSTPTLISKKCAVAAGSHSETMFAPAVLVSAGSVDLVGLLSNGTTVTDSNIASGKVHAVLSYRMPNALTA